MMKSDSEGQDGVGAKNLTLNVMKGRRDEEKEE